MDLPKRAGSTRTFKKAHSQTHITHINVSCKNTVNSTFLLSLIHMNGKAEVEAFMMFKCNMTSWNQAGNLPDSTITWLYIYLLGEKLYICFLPKTAMLKGFPFFHFALEISFSTKCCIDDTIFTHLCRCVHRYEVDTLYHIHSGRNPQC